MRGRWKPSIGPSTSHQRVIVHSIKGVLAGPIAHLNCSLATFSNEKNQPNSPTSLQRSVIIHQLKGVLAGPIAHLDCSLATFPNEKNQPNTPQLLKQKRVTTFGAPSPLRVVPIHQDWIQGVPPLGKRLWVQAPGQITRRRALLQPSCSGPSKLQFKMFYAGPFAHLNCSLATFSNEKDWPNTPYPKISIESSNKDCQGKGVIRCYGPRHSA